MRVLTMNICARHGDWDRRRDLLREGLRGLRPDVVAVQESVLTPEYDQVGDLLGEDFAIAHQGRREANGTGCSIASRWPIREVHETELSSTGRPNPAELVGRSMVAEIETPDRRLLVVNHKPSWRPGYELEREVETVAMALFIERVLAGRDLPVVLAGDLDAEPEAASVRFWAGRQSLHGVSVGYRDAWELHHRGEPGHTFTNVNAMKAMRWGHDIDRRIDYIFVGCDDHGPILAVESCELAFDQAHDGVWASDHFGLYAELTTVDPCRD